VAIVGAGPVGMVLAIELGRRGVPAVLVNDRPGTSAHPAANATQARTMEHFRRLGLAARIRALGLPADYPTDITYFTRYARHELARFSLPSSRDARSLVRTLSGSWSAAELPHRCSQMYIEEVLLDAVRRVRLMARESTPVRLVMKPDALELLAVTQDVGQAHEELDAKFDGTELTVAFNPEFLIQGAEVTQGDEIILETIDALKPALLKSADSPEFLYLLMPVRVS